MSLINLKIKYFKSKQLRGILFLVVFVFSATHLLAQEDKKATKWFNEAIQEYSVQSFDKAIGLCEKILHRNPDFTDAYLLLADIYLAADSTKREIEWLEKANKKTELPQIYYRLGNAYYALANYTNALKNFEKYFETPDLAEKRKAEVERKIESCKFATEAMKHPVEFHPERLSDSINTANDEYWPDLSIDKQQLVFTRLIKSRGQLPQEDFFISKFDSAGWSRAQPIIKINTPKNEGAQIVSADGKLLFFTACNRPNGRGSCDIYFSRWQNGNWTSPRNCGGIINSGYWEAQPGFSSDDRYLYFSSNRPGGHGKKDIWRAEFLGFDNNGLAKWEKPVNLGPNVNTEGNETSPFIHPNNKNFYFASDFHTGMGGFDVFMSEIKNDSVFSAPKNLGYPVNTNNDEQGLFISADGETAYFSSERNEKTGLDIYSFGLDEEIRPEPVTYLHAKIVDAITQKPLTAKLELDNLTNPTSNKRTEITDENGEVLLCLPVGSNYGFSVSKEGYLFFSESFDLSEHKSFYNPYNWQIELKPVEIGSEMNLYNVYFETDSFRILPESEPELNKLVDFLRQNSDLKVEIQGHTDNTGFADNNQILSEKRAKSVVNYLVKNGIDKQRLQWAGYGQARPVTTNETPEGRRLNRRTTIKILGM